VPSDIVEPGRRIRVYCWKCLAVHWRNTNRAFLSPCPVCGSTDEHVISSLDESRFTRADLAAMKDSWRP
jgi:Zn finger protein HypA/HybF involved in hydrogenase expression